MAQWRLHGSLFLSRLIVGQSFTMESKMIWHVEKLLKNHTTIFNTNQSFLFLQLTKVNTQIKVWQKDNFHKVKLP